MVVAYYSFRVMCNNLGGCGCGVWLRRNTTMNKRERARVTEKVGHACVVFQEWDQIVNNLTNRALTHVDCRTFTIKKFYQARNFSWCLKENDDAIAKTSTNKEYDEQKLSNIVDYIRRSAILDDVSFDEGQAGLISKKIHQEMKKMCRSARQ